MASLKGSVLHEMEQSAGKQALHRHCMGSNMCSTNAGGIEVLDLPSHSASSQCICHHRQTSCPQCSVQRLLLYGALTTLYLTLGSSSSNLRLQTAISHMCYNYQGVAGVASGSVADNLTVSNVE